MRIERVATEWVPLLPERVVASAGAQVSALDYLLLQLTTCTGIEGLGSVCVYSGSQVRALHRLIDDLADRVRGEDARFRGRIWQALWSATAPMGHAGLAMAALCAYDLALWDIAGKAVGLPVYQMIGAVRDRFPVYYSGLFLNLTLDELRAEARQVREQGFRFAKMRVGKPAMGEDIERVGAVREELGDGIRLMVDCSRAFDAGGAIRLGRRLEAFDLDWIEEPTPPEDLAGSARVAAALDTPIATGENVYTHFGVRDLIEQGAADVIQLDIQRLGGITGWLKAAALCEASHLPVSNHLFHEITGHALCACSGAVVAEYLPWRTPFEPRGQVVDGELRMGDAPGLGLAVAPEALRQYRAS